MGETTPEPPKHESKPLREGELWRMSPRPTPPTPLEPAKPAGGYQRPEETLFSHPVLWQPVLLLCILEGVHLYSYCYYYFCWGWLFSSFFEWAWQVGLGQTLVLLQHVALLGPGSFSFFLDLPGWGEIPWKSSSKTIWPYPAIWPKSWMPSCGMFLGRPGKGHQTELAITNGACKKLNEPKESRTKSERASKK